MKERIKRAMVGGAQLVPGEEEIEIHLDLRLGFAILHLWLCWAHFARFSDWLSSIVVMM